VCLLLWAGHNAHVKLADIEQLGLPEMPSEQAFADTVNWFRANGCVKK
jgi:hypothetical protein